MFSTLKNAWKIPDLRKRILYTFAMIAVFRLGSTVPVPGIDSAKLAAAFANSEDGLLGLFNLMSGGNFKTFTIFALGISPYITASIVLNLLQIAFPSLEALAREGEEGRKKIARYTRYLTVVLALIQGIGFSLGYFQRFFLNPGAFSTFISVLTLTAGTAFLMYLGEKITENGIGNGISLFIFAGIIARVPSSTFTTINNLRIGQVHLVQVIIFCIIAVAIISGVIFIQQGQRKIPVQYAKRVVGRKMYGGQSTHIPLKVNQAGVIPVIFAISILMFPLTISAFFPGSGFAVFVSKWLNQTSILYNVLYAILIFAFTFFYTNITFNPIEVSDRLKTNGGFIPGIRPGKPTAEYLGKSLNKITIVGGLFLAAIAILPNFLGALTNTSFSFGGTSLLIVVSVSLETMKQIEAQMLMRHYEGFLS
ncbi:preprotein translocase subunit SecY [Fusibacter ferrireducens]|uniref:Protein translocase subunit SecY n=1 Tax=Fusibacter ferrireducens TaxID=2785058 RepID=A0ABR9ZZE5_9FIRM|nr:preprotein translocase subunit SecY [Fusibacter ferrireducens]MBF4695827.1 preprotein translocase subunit SecY [Fusibacter ferrireducens]